MCGAALRGVGLDIAGRLSRLRAGQKADFAIIGIGGFLTPADDFASRHDVAVGGP